MKKIIAISMALIMCLGIMSMVAFAAPDGLSRLAMVGSGIPGVGEWNITDTAGDMQEVRESVYEKTLTLEAGAEMKFKVASDNGSGGWNDAYNFGSATLALGTVAEMENGGGSGDMSFKADKKMTITVTVDLNPLKDGGKATILVSEGTPPPPPTTTSSTSPTTSSTSPTTTSTQPTTTKGNGKRMLTIKPPATWNSVYVYTWEPADFGETFPGSEVKKSGNEYKVEIKDTMVNLIAAGRKADTTLQQTANIALELNGADIILTVKEDGTYDIEYVGVKTPERFVVVAKAAATKVDGKDTTFRVVGGGATVDGKSQGDSTWLGNWNPAFDGGLMKEVETGLYRKNFQNVEPGTYEMKITKDGNWDVSYGDDPDGKANCVFTILSKCDVTVDLTIKDGVGYIVLYGTGVLPSHGDISMLSVVVLMALASVTAIVLVVNKKKFI